eukprot:6651564-Prymnesium_polylepis.1
MIGDSGAVSGPHPPPPTQGFFYVDCSCHMWPCPCPRARCCACLALCVLWHHALTRHLIHINVYVVHQVKIQKVVYHNWQGTRRSAAPDEELSSLAAHTLMPVSPARSLSRTRTHNTRDAPPALIARLSLNRQHSTSQASCHQPEAYKPEQEPSMTPPQIVASMH